MAKKLQSPAKVGPAKKLSQRTLRLQQVARESRAKMDAQTDIEKRAFALAHELQNLNMVVKDKPWIAPFLENLAKTANVSASMRAAGVSRRALYDERRDNQAFAQAWLDALEDATDVLEAEIRRRAVEGTDEPVGWYQGNPGGYVKRYSDPMAMFLLRAHRPAYRDQHQHTISGPDGGPIQIKGYVVVSPDDWPDKAAGYSAALARDQAQLNSPDVVDADFTESEEPE